MHSALRLALLLTLLATAATAAELSLATWNIRNLATEGRVFHDGCCARSAADLGRLRAVAEELDADVVAVQEVSSLAALARVFPTERYILCLGSRTAAPVCRDGAGPLSDVPTADNPAQNLGFAVRRGPGIRIVSARNVAALSVAPDGGWPEHPGLELVLQARGGRLALLNVHLAGCYDDPLEPASPNPACRAMAAQADPLRAWIGGEGERFAVLGDFNRRFGREAGGAALGQALQASGASLLPQAPGLCWPDDPDPNHAHSVDWIAIGPGVTPSLGTSRRIAFGEFKALQPTPGIEEGRRVVSDHCPVRASVRF